MKYLILVLLLFGCTSQDKWIEPRFYKEQLIIYKVPLFLSTVCSGRGTVKRLICRPRDAFHCYKEQNLYYVIQTPAKEHNCPNELQMEESDLKARQE